MVKVGLTIFATLLATAAQAESLPLCAGDPARYIPNILPPIGTTSIAIPSEQAEAEVEVGETMISSVKADVHADAIVLARPVGYEGTEGGKKFSISIPAGRIAAESNDASVAYYQSDQGRFTQGRHGSSDPSVKVGISVPINSLSGAKVYWFKRASFWKGAKVMQYDIPGIEFTRSTCIQYGQDSFKRELVYSGVAQNVVSILYREFLHDMARPAFSQELKYDLSEGNEIGYKGARFQIIKAKNTSITYKVKTSLR